MPLTPNFFIEVLPYARGFTLSDHEKDLVDNIWSLEQKHFPHLFNGQILNVVQVEENKLVGEFIEYKYYFAQLTDPQLASVLNIQTLAISGITMTGDKILVGQRSEDVTTFKNFYELVPSGGIDPNAQVQERIDLKRQFELELWEESGISTTEIKSIKPLALIYDQQNKTYEIAAEITVNYTVLKEDLEHSQEYQKLQWFTKRELMEFIKKNKNFVPLSLFLLQKYYIKL